MREKSRRPSPLQRRALAWLAGYVGRDAAEQLATVTVWNGTGVEPAS
jgi:hypothetical protein